MIPAFTRWIKLLWKSPLTGLILTLGALILLLDDFVTWLRGGESALGDFWEMFGSREEQTERINKLLGFFRDHLQDIIKVAGLVLTAFAGWKILTTVLLGVSKAIYGIRTALIALSAHPIVALITAIIGAIMWLISAFQRCHGEVSKVWGTMRQDVIDFLDIFGGIGTKLKELEDKYLGWLFRLFPENSWQIITQSWNNLVNKILTACANIEHRFSNLGKSITQWFTNTINGAVTAWNGFCSILESWYNKIVGWFVEIGNAIKSAFSFDGITQQLNSLLEKVNPANWSLFGGDKEKDSIGEKKSEGVFSWFSSNSAKVPPVQEIDSRTNKSVNYASNSQYSINQNININTDNPDLANSLINQQSNSAVNNLRDNQSQVNASAQSIWG